MLNQVALIGRITETPDVVKTKESEVLNFAIAVNTGKEETSFFNCVAFNNVANVINDNVAKGDAIGVSGFLRQRKYTNKDGATRQVVEVVVERIQLLNNTKKEEAEPEEQAEEIPEGYYKGEDGKLHKNKTTKK